MKPISKIRFDALAAYARNPRANVYAEELAWFEHAEERVLGILFRDRTDNDYAGMVLARDELMQFRWTTMTEFHRSRHHARAFLRRKMEEAALAPDEEHHQGHRNPRIVDFFTPVVRRERLHPDFLSLVEQEGYSPARGMIEPMMRWYQDVDGNFIEQFQTTAFDARVWELYLYATFVELGFEFDRTQPAPDFVANGLFGSLAIEAVTVNPTRDQRGEILPPPPIDTDEQRLLFLKEYMPIKFGSALYSKLAKEYWTKPHVREIPFTIAIQDFSARGSMIFTRSAIQRYLYGYDHSWERARDGSLVITPQRVMSHEWEGKKIDSGFFLLPGAENVSAVIFSNSGTISKFNRIGLIAGFGSGRVQMVRQGTAVDHDPNAAEPLAFMHNVNDPQYRETWVEGMDVFHNPRAVRQLDPDMLPGAAHHFLQEDGQLRSWTPDWHPLGSITGIGVVET